MFKNLPVKVQKKIEEKIFETVLSELYNKSLSEKEHLSIIKWYNSNFNYKNDIIYDSFKLIYSNKKTLNNDKETIAEKLYSKLALEYIKSKYNKLDSRNIQINLYKTHINPVETTMKKPIWGFTINELKEYFKNIDSNSSNLKRSVYSFIKNYTDWIICNKGLSDVNNIKLINIEELISVDSKKLINDLYGLKNFYDEISILEKQTGIQNIILFVMARYGIMGADLEDALSLRISDIENDKVNIYRNNVLKTTVPIDEDFKFWCSKANAVKSNAKTDTIVKSINNNCSGEVSERAIYTRINQSKANFRLKDLYRSRVFDLVLEKRRIRKIKTTDIQNVLLMLDPSSSKGKYHSFKIWYENLTGDKVYSANTKDRSLKDKNAENFVNELRERLNYY